MKTDVLILGGGLAGLSTAHHLGRLGIRDRLVVEARKRVGGTAGSLTAGGFTFDFTGHLLHLHDPYGQRLVLDLLGANVVSRQRRAWIYSEGVYTRYPFQAHTRGLPDRTVVDCVAGFLETLHRPRPLPARPDFLSWCRATFGDGVTRRFMKPYNEKLWRVPLERLTTEWQGRFVPKPAAADVLSGALSDRDEGMGYNATFLYPRRGGIQALPDALAARLEPGVARVGARVSAVDLRERVARVDGLGEVRYERLVNTLPLVDFLDLVAPLPADARAARRRLRYNTVWNLNLGVARAGVSDKHWIYFPESRYPFYRVGFSTNFSRFVAPPGHSALYVEVARSGGARVDVPRLENAILGGLREAGILRRSDRLSARVWMPIRVGYVVYDFARAPALRTIFRRLRAAGVESIGRYGAWKYSFMEETLLDGKRCAERLAGVARGPEAAASAPLRALT